MIESGRQKAESRKHKAKSNFLNFSKLPKPSKPI